MLFVIEKVRKIPIFLVEKVPYLEQCYCFSGVFGDNLGNFLQFLGEELLMMIPTCTLYVSTEK